ncbi:MAG: MFS transporter [Terriglobales bacterium]
MPDTLEQAIVQTETLATPAARPLPYAPLLFWCCAVAFCCYVGSYMRIPVVPLYARSLGASTVQVGMINTAFLLMAGLLSLPLGILSDRVGRKLLAGFGASVLALSSFLLCFSKTPVQLFWIYVCFGMGLAAFGPTTMSMVVDFSPPTHLGRSYGWYTMALYVGMSLGPAMGGYTAQAQGYTFVFLVSGIILLLTLFGLILFLPSPAKVLPSRPRLHEDWVAIARQLMKNRPLLGCWLATIGGCFGLGMFITFLPLHARNTQLKLGQIGLVFAVQGIVNALSRIPFGHLSDKIPRRGDLVLIGSLGFSLSMVGFAMSRNAWQFMLFAIVLGISMGLAFTSVGALIAEVVPANSRGLAMGGYNTCIYLGMMLNAALMGGVIERLGFTYGFFLTALVNLLLAGVFYVLIKDFSAELRGE